MNDERHTKRFFIHPSLVHQIVLAQEETLISGVHDQSVFKFAGFFQVVDQAFDIVVNAFYASQVALEILLVDRLAVFRLA